MTDKLINRDPQILGGTPVFAGTRVPVRILMEHLEAGDRLDDFPGRLPPPYHENKPSRCSRTRHTLLLASEVMKLLLTSPVPRRLASFFPSEFEVRTVQQMGWAGSTNGALLRLATDHAFNALVTVDQGFEHQQNTDTPADPSDHHDRHPQSSAGIATARPWRGRCTFRRPPDSYQPRSSLN